MVVTGRLQARADAGQRALEVLVVVRDQPVGKGLVAFAVAVAGYNQVVAERSHQVMQPGDQRAALPLDQALVAAAHSLSASAAQQQYGTARQNRGSGHGRASTGV